jgi:short-subunit dehydrogenase
MVAQTQQYYGGIDVLINNAGQGMYVPIEQVNLHHYRSVFELNVVSVIGVMQAVIPIMRAQGGGVIVNISSGLAKTIVPGTGPYTSSKYALNAITLTARQELAEDHIRIGLVYPGTTATEFNHHLPEGRAGQETQRRSQTMAMSIESAEQVAKTILEAVKTEAAEVYTDNLKPFLQPS